MSSTNNHLTSLHTLLKESKIEIPIIQRDYAQGRDSKEVNILRKSFLSYLASSLDNNNSIRLDFIYGSKEGDNFQPLDGQQRLTTLYLIYWYCACKENKGDLLSELLEKFTYETKTSTTDFCKKLSLNHIAIESDTVISEELINENWFYFSWLNDPSISGMLRTLDDVHSLFYSVDNIYEKLVDKNLIQFYNVELEKIGLSDELYIKMNARGKQLTHFENFKAGLEKIVSDSKWDVDGGFKNKVDKDYTDYFWSNYRKGSQIDNAFVNLFAFLGMVITALENEDDERDQVIKELNENTNSIYPEHFNTEANFEFLQDTLDDIIINYKELVKIELNFNLWNHTPDNPNDFLSEILRPTGELSYSRKVLLYAQLVYLRISNETTIDERKYLQWMRFVRNIVARGNVDVHGNRPDLIRSPRAFVGILRLLNEIRNECTDIETYLLSDVTTKSLYARDQIREERYKAQLIDKGLVTESLIHEMEEKVLHRGSINFLFTCMKDPYNIDDFDITEFMELKEILSKPYFTNGLVSNDLKRALLTICVDDTYEFYGYWKSSWNMISGRKVKLLKEFTELEYLMTNKYYNSYLINLVNKLRTNTLQGICDDFVAPDSFPSWKLKLIKEKSWLDNKAKSSYIAIDEANEYCYLLISTRPRDKKGSVKVK